MLYVVSQIGAVGDEIHTVHGADAGVLDPILLVFCKKPLFSGSDEGLGRNLKSEASSPWARPMRFASSWLLRVCT
jgi:hypothetical protein